MLATRFSLKSGLLALVLAGGAAAAPTHTFVDTHLDANSGPDGWFYLTQGSTFTRTWDISDEPSFSTGLIFTDASAEFWFADDWWDPAGQTEIVSIDVGALSSWFQGDVDGTIDYNYNLLSYDLIFGDLTLSVLADIAADGQLTYSITALGGDTIIKQTRLTVNAVPDQGTTLALLGVGLVGLGAFRRRFAGRA